MTWAIGAPGGDWSIDLGVMSDWVRREWPQASEVRDSRWSSRAIVWTWPDSFEVSLGWFEVSHGAKYSGLTFSRPDTTRLADFALKFYRHFGEGRQLVLASGAGDLIDLQSMRDNAQLIAAIDGVEADE